MRRKAEILKYSSNKSSTKTNNLTRAEKWSQLARSSNTTNKQISRTNCKMIYTPSYASDVPGPIIELYDNETIPLYNYNTNTYAYSLYSNIPNNKQTFSPYTFSTADNIIVSNCYPSNPVQTKLFSIVINDNINNENQSQSFTFSTPIAFNINGNNRNSQTTLRIDEVTIKSIQYVIKFNGDNIFFTDVYLPDTESSYSYPIDVEPNSQFLLYFYNGIITLPTFTISMIKGYVYEYFLIVSTGFSSQYIPQISISNIDITFNVKDTNITQTGLNCEYLDGGITIKPGSYSLKTS